MTLRHVSLFAFTSILVVAAACSSSSSDDTTASGGGGGSENTTGGTSANAGTTSAAGTGGTAAAGAAGTGGAAGATAGTGGTAAAGTAGTGGSTAGTGGTATAGAAGTGGAVAGAGGTAAGSGGSDAGTGGTATAGSGGTGGSTTSQFNIRFVNLVADVPALDVCIAGCTGGDCTTADFTAVKPFFTTAGDAGKWTTGVASIYFGSDVGSYSVRAVASDATDCSTALAGSTDATVDVGAEGNFVDIIVNGLGSAALINSFVVPDAPTDGSVGFAFFNGGRTTGSLSFGVGDAANNDLSTSIVSGVSQNDSDNGTSAAADNGETYGVATASDLEYSFPAASPFKTAANETYTVFAYEDATAKVGLVMCFEYGSNSVVAGSTTIAATCQFDEMDQQLAVRNR